MNRSEKIKVSIVMNCYNGERFLKESLDSVIRQEFKNWELIFWDNRSNDKSADILYSFKEERFKYYLAENHTTLHLARNLALKKTSGNFITFLDTDDFWEKDKLKLQIKTFEQNKDINCVYSKFWIKYNNSIFPNKLITFTKLPTGDIFKNLINKYNFSFGSLMVKRNCLNNFPNVFDTKINYISDFDFTLKLAKKNKFLCVQKPIYTCRKHKKNFSNNILKDQAYQFENWMIQNKEECFFSENEYNKLLKHLNYMKVKAKIKESNFIETIKVIFSQPLKISSIKLLFFYFFKEF